jgi:hypothetical protein
MSTKLAGIMVSECVDSEQDRFMIGGLSIENLRGAIVNSEHEKSFTKTVGKIIEVRKILKEDDCRTEQELRLLTKNNKMPFVYGVVELFDDQKHLEALSIAQIVDFHKSGDKGELPLGYSIEVEPVSVSSNKVYSLSVAKRVALVRLPANKACVVEIYNPGPQVLNKSEKEPLMTKSKEEIDAQLQSVIGNLVSQVEIFSKSLEAGYAMGPAGTNVQGAALQRTGVAQVSEETSDETKGPSESDMKRFKGIVKSIMQSAKMTRKV